MLNHPYKNIRELDETLEIMFIHIFDCYKLTVVRKCSPQKSIEREESFHDSND